MKLCSIDGCAKRARCRRMCDMHYTRWLRHGDPVITRRAPHDATEEGRLRFTGWTVVQRLAGMAPCWEWNGGTYRAGYGQVSVGGNRCDTASRVAYRLWVGDIPPGEDVCHRCDNPPCINPEHLFAGSRHLNMADSSSKFRLHFGEQNGSAKLTEAQVADIRAAYASGETQSSIAVRFGVSRSNIGMIASYRTWPKQSA